MRDEYKQKQLSTVPRRINEFCFFCFFVVVVVVFFFLFLLFRCFKPAVVVQDCCCCWFQKGKDCQSLLLLSSLSSSSIFGTALAELRQESMCFVVMKNKTTLHGKQCEGPEERRYICEQGKTGKKKNMIILILLSVKYRVSFLDEHVQVLAVAKIALKPFSHLMY